MNKSVTSKQIVVTIVICIVVFALGLAILFMDRGPDKESGADVDAHTKTASVALSPYGIEPKFLTVEKGTTVTFFNKSANPYWLSMKQGYELEGFGSVGIIHPGQSYSFVFSEVGVWAYREQAYGKFDGVIQVENVLQ